MKYGTSCKCYVRSYLLWCSAALGQFSPCFAIYPPRLLFFLPCLSVSPQMLQIFEANWESHSRWAVLSTNRPFHHFQQLALHKDTSRTQARPQSSSLRFQNVSLSLTFFYILFIWCCARQEKNRTRLLLHSISNGISPMTGLAWLTDAVVSKLWFFFF